MVCLLRYAQVIEHSQRCWVNTSALVSGCTNAVGLVMVGNFQVSVADQRPVLCQRVSGDSFTDPLPPGAI